MSKPASSKDRSVHIKAGTTIVQEDALSRNMYVIRSGKVRVFKTYLDQRVTLAILGPGEIFGELSFLDAEPRTASVEALIDVEVVVISGEKASEQISSLPSWVMPIFRSVFFRLREADAKLTVLESINELQKKDYTTDSPGKKIYEELLRLIKTLQIFYTREKQRTRQVKASTLLQSLETTVEKKFIGLKVFWRLLKEYDFMDHQLAEATGTVVLREESLESWKHYLQTEIKSERYLLIGQPSLAVLRKIVGRLHSDKPLKNSPVASLTFQQIQLETLPLYKIALKELRSREIIRVTKNTVYFVPLEVIQIYTFQSIIKNFDQDLIAGD